MYLCAKRLVPFIRDNIDYFAQKCSYDEKLKAKLAPQYAHGRAWN